MGRRNKKKEIKNVHIHGIADKGMAVGKTPEGKIIFTEGAVPGDTIDFVSLRKKKGFLQGVTKEIISPSPYRIDPLCQHFDDCGGCKWQNLMYEKQLEEKESIVINAIEKIAGIKDAEILPIIGMEQPFYYRNKMEFSFSNKRWITQDEVDSGKEITQTDALGLHRPRSFDKIVDITECHLVPGIVDKIRNEVRDYTIAHNYSYFDIRKQNGLMRGLIIRTNLKEEVMIMPIFYKNDQEKINALMKHLEDSFPEIKTLYYMVNPKKNDSLQDIDAIHFSGEDYLIESLGHIVYHIGPKSFFQTNTSQGVKLYDLAKEFAELNGTENVYDLYTGLGSIALYLSDMCKKVVGIEEIAPAIEDARLNAEVNGINNTEFVVGDVRDILKPDFIETHGKPDLIITDPPRAGMHPEVVDVMLHSGAEKIVYVSCKPSTMARDIKILSEKYKLIKAQAVDMFPHTNHVESVCLLKLRK